MPDRGRPPQIAPGAAQRPAEPRARPDVRPAPLAPSAPVLARRGYACTVPTTPAEYAAPLTMPLQGVMSGFYIPHTSDRVDAFSRVLRPSGVPCDIVRIVPSRGPRERPAEDPPGGRKGTRPEVGRISAAFPSGFSLRFSSRIFFGSQSAHMRPIVACHSRLIVAYSLTSSPVVSMAPSPSASR